MRKMILFTLACFGTAALLPSCSKTAQKDMVLSPSPSTQVINATVTANSTYQLTLDAWQNASISKQAAHFKLSVAGMDTKTNKLTYSYSPADDFTGEDEVTLSTKTTETSTMNPTGGCRNMNDGSHEGNSSSYTGSTPATTYTYTYMTVKIKVTR